MNNDQQTAASALVDDYFRHYPDELTAELEKAPPAEIIAFLASQHPDRGASLLARLRPDVAADVILDLDTETRRALLSVADPSRMARVVARFDRDRIASLLEELDQRTSSELQEIMGYPPDAAGAMMDPRVSHFRAEWSADEALIQLRDLRHLRISSLHVVDEQGLYLGSIRLQDLALADPNLRLRELMIAPPVSVQAMMPQAEVVELLERHRLPSLPVVNFAGQLIGVIRQNALLSAVEAEATTDIQTMVGASRNERALSPVLFAVSKRLPWLNINLLTAFLASFVVGLFEDTIARFTALAILLPVVAGQSGNTGAQALAVTMRGLALREIRVHDHSARVAIKEGAVAAINGVAIALVTAGAVFFWSRSAALAGVIGVAMVISMIIAGLAGATIPMVLTLLGQDPAQASSIVLTTVTDVAGFLSFLGLATVFVNLL